MSTGDLDVAKVMGELRAGIRKARGVVAHPKDGGISEDAAHRRVASGDENSLRDDIAAEIASLHQGYDIVRAPFYSNRRRIGRAIIFAKNIARELLIQILARQVNYNGANTRVVTYLRREIESLRSQLEEVREQSTIYQDSLRADIRAALSTDADERKRECCQMNLDLEYFKFEQKHRGSEADVSERQRPYISCFEGLSEVLDIGCGRGEFLQLLRQAGISHQGVDANPEMVEHCHRKGLDVTRADGTEFLAELSDQSLGGIFCAQMIEHLEPSLVITLVHLCHRKLRLGGVLIVETPNPGCLTTFAEAFYKDFMHVRTYHPAGVKLLFESAGFEGAEIKFGSPVDPSIRIATLKGSTGLEFEKLNHGIERLNDLIYGYQDYAVIGRKGTNRSP